jgi:hypothetical protein
MFRTERWCHGGKTIWRHGTIPTRNGVAGVSSCAGPSPAKPRTRHSANYTRRIAPESGRYRHITARNGYALAADPCEVNVAGEFHRVDEFYGACQKSDQDKKQHFRPQGKFCTSGSGQIDRRRRLGAAIRWPAAAPGWSGKAGLSSPFPRQCSGWGRTGPCRRDGSSRSLSVSKSSQVQHRMQATGEFAPSAGGLSRTGGR